MPKAYAWTTAQRLADFAGLGTVTGTTQTILERVIDTGTEALERYLGRRIQETTYTNELYDGDGTNLLFLKQYPVNSTSSFSIQVRTSGVNEDSWDTVNSELYYVHYKEGYVESSRGLIFLSQPRKYRVTYTAGYDFDNSSTFLSDTEAGDLEFVIWKIGTTLYNNRKGEIGVKSESISDYRIEYTGLIYQDTQIREILDAYRRQESFTYPTPSH